jgi:leader peptidase (prepilin peptidase)/N-methyltransferase
LGLCIGSFLNVLDLRFDNLKSIVNSRSHCPKCHHNLSALDLIPVASYFLLKGKCRYCEAKISPQYPIVELATGITFAALFYQFGLQLSFLYYAVIFSLLIVIFVYDLKSQTIPELYAWIALILSAAGGWYFGGFGLLNMIWGGLIGGGILAFLVLVSREKWMGAGDIKIGLILGLLLGYPVAIFGMFLAFFFGSVVGLIFIKYANKTLKSSIPFAPFLIFATFLSIFFGMAVVAWYFGNYFYY